MIGQNFDTWWVLKTVDDDWSVTPPREFTAWPAWFGDQPMIFPNFHSAIHFVNLFVAAYRAGYKVGYQDGWGSGREQGYDAGFGEGLDGW